MRRPGRNQLIPSARGSACTLRDDDALVHPLGMPRVRSAAVPAAVTLRDRQLTMTENDLILARARIGELMMRVESR